MTFTTGQSGNPNGRPKGAKNRATELRKLLEPHAPALVEKAVHMALNGDTAALKMCLDKLMPNLKAQDLNVWFDDERTVVFTLDMGKDLKHHE